MCLCMSELSVEPKSEKEKLKEKYPALCKPDAPAWTVRLIGANGMYSEVLGSRRKNLILSC